jgi:methenyltetrahydromethanopterin cyclohydrolase
MNSQQLNLNEKAYKVWVELSREVNVTKLSNGAKIADASIGGFSAGLYLSRITLSDLAQVSITHFDAGGVKLPAIEIFLDSPALPALGSQLAGWSIRGEKFNALASGPGRILARKPKKIFEKLRYEERADKAVLFLETSSMPDEKITDEISRICNIPPENLYLAVARTSSVPCLIQVSARIVETGIHKLHSLGFDPSCIENASGIAPVAPVVGDDTRCMGVSNDCIIYCGSTYYTIKYENLDELEEYIKKTPSCTSKDYGIPFYETFKNAGFDFYKIDPGIFSPAFIMVNEISSGKVFTAGKIAPEILLKSIM